MKKQQPPGHRVGCNQVSAVPVAGRDADHAGRPQPENSWVRDLSIPD